MAAPPLTHAVIAEELDRIATALAEGACSCEAAADDLRRLLPGLHEPPAAASPAAPVSPAAPAPAAASAAGAEAYYHELFKITDQGFCTIEVLFDKNGDAADYRFLEINPAFEKHTGLVGARGRRVRELAPDLDEHWFRIYGRVARSGAPTRFEDHSARLGRWFEVYAFRIGRPEQHQVAVLFSDITARKLSDEALHQSESLFRAVADNIPQLAWMTDAAGEILWFNRRWFDYTGLSLEEMRLRGWQYVHHPEHPHSIVAGWVHALETGEPWEDTFQLRGRDGGYRWFLSRAFPIRDESGRISRWFGTNTDIGQLRETEEALKKAHRELQQHAANLEIVVADRTAKLRDTLQELEIFSYSLSHDLRAPLRAMRGFAEILEEQYGEALDPDGLGYLRRIAAAGARLEQLIQDILAYGGVLREDFRLSAVDPGALVRTLIGENPSLQSPHAEIILREPLHPVQGHEACLTQVLSNLIYNAVKFVAPGRTPRLELWTEPDGEDAVRLFVRDNGIGFPAEAREQIYGKFQRFHRTSAYEGTGLGLAIVRKAIERMGGSVDLESTPGAGSTFILRFARPTPPA